MVAELKPELQFSTPPEALTQLGHHSVRHAGMKLEFVTEQQQAQVDEYTIVVPGLFGIHSAYAGLRHQTALLDATVGVISLDPPRHADWRHPDRVLSKAVWGVAKAVVAETGATKINLTGHSMGGVGAVHAARHIMEYKDPELLGTVTLNASAGVTGHNLLSLLPRARRWGTDSLIHNRQDLLEYAGGRSALRDLARYTVHHQTLLEIKAVCNANILDDISALSEAGVTTTALYFAGDPLFDPEDAERNLAGRVHAFDVLEQPPLAGHNAPQRFPKHVAAANEALKRRVI